MTTLQRVVQVFGWFQPDGFGLVPLGSNDNGW
jgi:hypothetical protein